MEVTYQLPSGRQHTSSFEKLFNALDKNLVNLGVVSYGISDTTLEEVSPVLVRLLCIYCAWLGDQCKKMKEKEVIGGQSNAFHKIS